MRVISAYLLAVLGGNSSPAEADIKKILSSVGIEADAENVKKLISELKGKSLEEVMKAGKDKLATVPSGAGAAPAAAAAAPAAGGAKAAPAAKKEEKKEESEDEDMGFSLFD